jgi:hypothetical protein
MTPEQEAIRALVCGMPEPLRSQCRIMALQAFVDESGTDGPPVLGLGGWVSSVARWELFTKEWKQCLDMHPRIGVLKMREAMKLRGAFYGWSAPERDRRIRLFSDIIFSHADIGLFFRVPYADIDKINKDYPNVSKRFKSKYFWAFHGLLTTFMRDQRSLGFFEPVKFVFDENAVEKDAIYEAWDFYVCEWKKLGFLVGSAVSFEDDEVTLPLQAAELIAWQTRVTWDSAGGQSSPFSGTGLRMPKLWGADFTYSDEIRDYIERQRGKSNRPAPQE